MKWWGFATFTKHSDGLALGLSLPTALPAAGMLCSRWTWFSHPGSPRLKHIKRVMLQQRIQSSGATQYGGNQRRATVGRNLLCGHRWGTPTPAEQGTAAVLAGRRAPLPTSRAGISCTAPCPQSGVSTNNIAVMENNSNPLLELKSAPFNHSVPHQFN